MAEEEAISAQITNGKHFASSIEKAMEKGAKIEIEVSFKGFSILQSLVSYTFLIVIDEVVSLENGRYGIIGHLEKKDSTTFTGTINLSDGKITGKGTFSE